jgi:hypothetical protein
VTALAVSLWLDGQPVGVSIAGPAERMRKHREHHLSALREVSQCLQKR